MPTHARDISLKHWSKNVRDVSVAHDSLHVRIEGGAENGEFLYVGDLIGQNMKFRKGRLRVGDIFVELNDEPVVGLTLQSLMSRINQAGKKVNFKVVQPGGGISKDLRDFLGKDLANSSEVDNKLQDILRENLYSKTVPCTTRPPRSREEPGIDYIFVSKERFQEMEKNGDFLESGTYNGHYYGTVKPAFKMDLKGELLTIQENEADSLVRNGETPRSVSNDVGDYNIGNVTIHQERSVLDEGGDLGRNFGDQRTNVGDLGRKVDVKEWSTEESDSVRKNADQRDIEDNSVLRDRKV